MRKCLIGILKYLLHCLEHKASLPHSEKQSRSIPGKKATVILIGDSNYHYEGNAQLWTCFGLTDWIIITLDIKYDSAGAFVKHGLSKQGLNIIRWYARDFTGFPQREKDLLADFLEVLHDHTVHVIMWIGQNDADKQSRASTRNFEEIKEQFAERMTKKCEETEKFFNEKGIDVHWIIPFDDAMSTFSPLYVDLVGVLKQVYSTRPLCLDISDKNYRFEPDQYHFDYASRQVVAQRISRYIVDKMCNTIGAGSLIDGCASV